MATSRKSGSVLNSTQRTAVRLALATGATIVTLMGAQILAFQDQSTSASADVAANVLEQPVSSINSSSSSTTNTSNTDDTRTTNSNQTASVAVASPTAISPTAQPTAIKTAAAQPTPRTRSSRRG